MICLIRGTNSSRNHTDRVAVAVASTIMQKYNKRVLILQTDNRFPAEKVMMGARIQSNTIRTESYSFTDEGMDALIRRTEIGPVSHEQFTDCCLNISKTANSFDIAGVPGKEDFGRHIVENETMFKQLLTSAAYVYDVVLITADATDNSLVKMLEENVDREIVCVKQGPKEVFAARDDAAIAVVNYDDASTFNLKAMAKAYGKKTAYGILYNTGFNDACLKDYALSYLFSNNTPNEHDDNYYFVRGLKFLVENILGLDEVELKDRDFVYRSGTKKTMNAI